MPDAIEPDVHITGKRFMWSQNAFTDRLNLKWPILQAPMGPLSTPALAAAVSNLAAWGASACGVFQPRTQSGGSPAFSR